MRRTVATATLLAGLLGGPALACDLCSPPPPEFAAIQDEIRAAPTVVLADLAGEDMAGRTQLLVREVLRGGSDVLPGQAVTVDEPLSIAGVYLLFGNRGSFEVRRPRRVEEDVASFAILAARAPTRVESEPEPWGEWLARLVPYLSHENERIAISAGKEFADAPYAAVKAVRDHVESGPLLAALEAERTAVRSRGALALLAGLCGTKEDAPRLERLMDDTRFRGAPGHDAVIAAYLMLRGPEGLPRVRRMVRERLGERDARTGLSALAALRFHAQNETALPRPAIVAEVRALLDSDALAPAAILELATLEDWDSLPLVMEAFRRLRPKGPMVLGPAARYVQECPLPEAAAARAEVTGRRPDAPEPARD